MSLTRGGIEYNLEESPFRVISNNITFIFSSNNHKLAFLERVNKNREKINESLSGRFYLDIKFNTLADINLYRKIETRGFLIIVEGDYIWETQKVKLDGVKVMKKN